MFAIDISGSMSGGRINCVRQVLAKAVTDITKNNPDRKIGLLLFESSVHIIGDGQRP